MKGKLLKSSVFLFVFLLFSSVLNLTAIISVSADLVYNQVQLSYFPGESDILPSISGDGSNVVWQHSYNYVWIVTSEGYSAAELDMGWGPSIDGDGSRVAYSGSSETGYEIFIMDLPGGDPVNLTSTSGRSGFSPSISADGNKIAFQYEFDISGQTYKDICVVDATDPENPVLTVLVTDVGSSPNDRGPSISADGSKVVFTGDLNDETNEIWVVDSNGENLLQLTNNAYDDDCPSISGDGSVIAFRSDRVGGYQLWIVDSSNSSKTQLTTTMADVRDPRISADGSKIAFASNSDGNNEIYVINSDGTGLLQLTTTYPDNNYWPSISADGLNIAFVKNLGGEYEIFALNSDGLEYYPLTLDIVGEGSVRVRGVTYSDDAVIPVPAVEVGLTAIADEGYTFTGWSDEFDEPILGGLSNPSNPFIIEGPMFVRATFGENVYSLTVNLQGSGHVRVRGVTYNESVVLGFPAGYPSFGLTAIAGEGYVFAGWREDPGLNILGGTSNPSNPITLEGDMVVTAVFQPDNIYGLNIHCFVEGMAPSSDWTYIITDAGSGEEVFDPFDLPGVGGWSDLLVFEPGEYLVHQVGKAGYGTLIDWVLPEDEIIVTFSGDYNIANVEFVNEKFALSDSLDSLDLEIDIELAPLTPTPVQAAWPVDLDWDGDATLDLVANKPTTVLVDIVPTSYVIDPAATYVVQITFGAAGATYNKVVTGVTLEANSIVAFDPMIPVGGEWDIGGAFYLADVNGAPVGSPIDTFTSTTVTVRDTNDLSVYFQSWKKGGGAYSPVSSADLQDTETTGGDFVGAVYPISSLTTGYGESTFSGTKNILGDLIKLASKAQSKFSGSPAVGVGVVGPDYWTYHLGAAFPDVAGISWGPAVKGVAVGAGYYSAVAHEIGHTYGLYWGTLEQYELPGYPDGIPTSGVWPDYDTPSASSYRQGIDFMGKSAYGTLEYNWVDSETSWQMLFEKTSQMLTDPKVVFVGGIAYSDGKVEIPVDWTYVDGSFADNVPTGDYEIVFYNSEGVAVGSVRFDAQFFFHIDPGVTIGENDVDGEPYGQIFNADYAGFGFTTQYPDTAVTAKIFKYDPANPQAPPIELELFDTRIDDEDPIPIDEIVPMPPDTTPPEIWANVDDYDSYPLGPSGFELQFSVNDPESGIEIEIETLTNYYGTVTVTSPHIIENIGVYALHIEATNRAGLTAVRDILFTIYDPSAGFVTGAGWIDSPEDAYLADPDLTGKATFSFVSKYKKGANVPQGHTEFQFKIADLKFKSTSYDWLVIAGNLAVFKGTGTINGEGEYMFQIWAGDEGKNGADTFRIKIVDKSTDLVIYDNAMQQEIEGGSIIIHKK